MRRAILRIVPIVVCLMGLVAIGPLIGAGRLVGEGGAETEGNFTTSRELRRQSMDIDSLLGLPVVPVWARLGAPVVISDAFTTMVTSSISDSLCPLLFSFQIRGGHAAIRFDAERMVTEVFAVDTGSNTDLVRHDIDSLLNHVIVPLPLAWGVPWVAKDLDLDGQIELIVQRGGGGDGYLDIHSAPNWVLRRRFVYPGLNTVMHPVAVNIDADPYLELYVTPNGDVVGRAVIIKYDAGSGNFVSVADIPAPYGAVGHPAVADFDNDGRMEFVSGGSQGYMLYEWQDTGLVYIGPVGRPPSGNDFHASAVRPKPGGVVHLLLGHSGSSDGKLHELLEPVGNNAFNQVQVFHDSTAWIGIHPNWGRDTDCNGVDELVLDFYPFYRQFEWKEDSAEFGLACMWSAYSWGTFLNFCAVDVNQNGVAEMGTINHNDIFGVFAQDCDSCDVCGRCPFAGPWCECPCHGDPNCDGQINVLDVISVIDVAFRGAISVCIVDCPRDGTDLDCNRATDVVDVVRVVDVAFRGAQTASTLCDPCDL